MPERILHPTNVLKMNYLQSDVEDALIEAGIRFVTILPLRERRKKPLLLCGRYCPAAAGTSLLQSALRLHGGAI